MPSTDHEDPAMLKVALTDRNLTSPFSNLFSAGGDLSGGMSPKNLPTPGFNLFFLRGIVQALTTGSGRSSNHAEVDVGGAKSLVRMLTDSAGCLAHSSSGCKRLINTNTTPSATLVLIISPIPY